MKKHIIFEKCICQEHNKSFNANESFYKMRHHKITNIFYHNSNFYAITANSCIAPYNDYHLFTSWVTQIVNKSKLLTINEIPTRSIFVDQKLKDLRKKDQFTKMSINEYNFFYDKYAIVTKINFMDCLVNNQDLKENYENALKYLQNNGLTDNLEKLKSLYENNRLEVLSPVEVIRTTDHLIECFKNQINKKYDYDKQN